MSHTPATRRSVLTAALAAAAAGALAPAAQAAGVPAVAPGAPLARSRSTVAYHGWASRAELARGRGEGTALVRRPRAGIVLDTPQGTAPYTDPHTDRTAEWEYAVWTSPLTRLRVPAGELVASWNAHTPAGTWLRVELEGTYTDGTATPRYVLGVWTAGDGDDVPRRTSVDDQGDGRSSVYTDTFAVDDLASGLRLASYRLRVTLYRAPGSEATPTVWRIGAMSSDVPDRFEVPATTPGVARGVELRVPRYSQNTHIGQYPEYDGGGEAWCSPTSSQMILEYWGRKPTAGQLSWVNPDFADPQVCHAARYTYDYQYEGCGNWPFNAAYASTYEDMEAVVTRLDSLHDAETLIAAGIPLITSQSFIEADLDGAGYGTAGHLMTIVGFTEDGDVVANDPASDSNAAVRNVYKRRQFENVWLRTKRKDANGQVKSGTGGVCYVYFPTNPTPTQHRVLRKLGLL